MSISRLFYHLWRTIFFLKNAIYFIYLVLNVLLNFECNGSSIKPWIFLCICWLLNKYQNKQKIIFTVPITSGINILQKQEWHKHYLPRKTWQCIHKTFLVFPNSFHITISPHVSWLAYRLKTDLLTVQLT